MKRFFWRRQLRSERGQIAILVAMMSLTFIAFFAFVLNTGTLVNAKINLQNAADMAAYAGAAVQARQLNHISYLNYEMRRQYKKFLYRYYVYGGSFYESHPSSSNPGAPSTGRRRWLTNNTPQAQDLLVPVTCLNLSGKSDRVCSQNKLEEIPGKKLTNGASADVVTATLRYSLNQMESNRLDNCVDLGRFNALVLTLWLWKTTPDSEDLARYLGGGSGNPSDAANKVGQTLQASKVITYGLGLIPREFLLWLRINTLKSYVNEAPKRELNISQARQLATQGDIAKNERTIQAYYSAFNTLGNGTFDNTQEIKMSELLPSKVLELTDIRVGFDTYSAEFQMDETKYNKCKNDPKEDCFQDCIMFPRYQTSRLQVPVGVYKSPENLTYYAIKLEAPAKTLFSPFGDMTLRAYAAARPFGSRIGPRLDDRGFVMKAKNTASCNDSSNFVQGQNPTPCTEQIPNLPVRKDEAQAQGNGWDTNDLIRQFYKGLTEPFGIQNLNPGRTEMEYGLRIGMAPNPWEEGQYNIISSNDDPFASHLLDFRYPESDGAYAFWAPLVPEGQDAAQVVTDEIKKLRVSGQFTKLSTPGQGFNVNDFKDALSKGIQDYISKLQMHKRDGEEGEGFNIVRIQDPTRHYEGPGRRKPALTAIVPGLPQTLVTIQPDKIKSSWNTTKDPDFSKARRTGYSVKMVSLKSLRKLSDPSTNDSGHNTQNATNALPVLDPADFDDNTGVQH